MVKKLIAIDLQAMEKKAKDFGFDYFPLKELREAYGDEGVDIVDIIVALPVFLPEEDTNESLGSIRRRFENKRYAIQMSGGRVIECPSKKSGCTLSGIKHSDDQWLMMETYALALKTRPDYVVLFAADGDFAPMVDMLRREGVRTEVVADTSVLSGDLACHAVNVVDYETVLEKLDGRRKASE